MDYFLEHIGDWLLLLLSLKSFLVLILLCGATIVLNSMTEASDVPRMTGNFLSVSAGALAGSLVFPDWSPPLPPDAQFVFALFSGMTLAALANMALFRPA